MKDKCVNICIKHVEQWLARRWYQYWISSTPCELLENRDHVLSIPIPVQARHVIFTRCRITDFGVGLLGFTFGFHYGTIRTGLKFLTLGFLICETGGYKWDNTCKALIEHGAGH